AVADVAISEQPLRSGRLFLAGVSLTLGNPKAMIFFLALLPTVIDLGNMSMGLYLQIALAIVLILSAVLSSYSIAAMRARRLFRSPRALRWLNRASGAVMSGAAVAVATR